MRLPRTVAVVVLCAIGYFRPVFCEEEVVMPPKDDAGDDDSGAESSDDDKKFVEPTDKHTFVALIDIVFTDGIKRSCTGTVIHDRVVITAAHCFVNTKNEFIMPEVTLSFVVIGTKNMFDTGYEHYLPIEKIETHPEFKGWTADLALVFTFAGMQSDKPGKVIPLGGEKAFTPVDSNLTVISWGKCKSDKNYDPSYSQRGKDHEREGRPRGGQLAEQRGMLRGQQRAQQRAHQRAEQQMEQRGRYLRAEDETIRTTKSPEYEDSEYEDEDSEKKGSNLEPRRSPGFSSRYLNTASDMKGFFRSIEFNKTFSRRNLPAADDYNSYKNWRRVMGSQKNELSVELFGFVSVQACRKVVERIMPAIYQIKNVNEILCYSSEDHYITKEDSGAPAIQQGQLVAVTVGGIETEGNHIAIGMKMSCFCPWIANSLPDGGDTLECCKDCCDIKHFKGEENKNRHLRARNNNKKKLYSRSRSLTSPDDYEETTKAETFQDFWNKN